MAKKILVLGGAHIDRRGRITGETVPGASNPGTWLEEPGGGAFNAARNLARLGFDVRLVSPRGGDAAGEVVSEAARAAGIDDRPFVFLDRRTPSYTAIIESDGSLVIGLADMDLYRLFSPRRLSIRAIRDAFDETDIVLCDANLPEETLEAISVRAEACRKPLAAIAISPAKVVRFRHCLERVDFLFMNEAEAAALSGGRPADAADWPGRLRAIGLKGGVVTRGRDELIAFRGETAACLAPPVAEAVSDVTGAGDSFAAGTLSALLDDEDMVQAVRHGAACAAITVASPQATADNLSPKLMKSMLALVAEARILS